MGKPTEYIEMLHGRSGVGVTTADHLGDWYYSGVISAMRFTSNSYNDLDYSNPLYAWVGENLRSVVGNKRMAHRPNHRFSISSVKLGGFGDKFNSLSESIERNNVRRNTDESTRILLFLAKLASLRNQGNRI